MPIFFVEKMREAFAVQKLLSFFLTKNISVFGYKVVKHLTVDLLTSSLSSRCFEQPDPGKTKSQSSVI